MKITKEKLLTIIREEKAILDREEKGLLNESTLNEVDVADMDTLEKLMIVGRGVYKMVATLGFPTAYAVFMVYALERATGKRILNDKEREELKEESGGQL